MKKIIASGVSFILILSSCSSNDSISKKNLSEDKILVTTSFYPVYFFTKAIGGDKANVINLTPPGAEPHEFEPSVQDRLLIERSGMFVINGGVEAWGEKLIPELEQKSIVTVIAGKDTNTQTDPHVWLSPKHAKIMIGNIFDGYDKADAKNSTTYKKNSLTLLQEINKLDLEYSETFKNCKRKDIVTSHAAFGYLSDYGLNQIALTGISPESEPSAKAISQVVDIIRQKNVKVIFTETLISPRLAETVAKETGAYTLVLNPLEGLTDKEEKAGDDYFSVMRKNLFMLTQALDCQK